MGLEDEGSLASTAWVIMLYNKTSTRTEGLWRDATHVVLLEDNNERSEYDNLGLVDHSITYLVVVVTVFMASINDGVPPTVKQSGSDYFLVCMRNIFNPNFKGNVITGLTASL